MVAGFEALDFHAFHRGELQRRLAAGHGALAAAEARRIGPIAFRLPGGDAYSYVPGESGIDVLEGEGAARTVVELSQEAWEGLVHDLESAPGLLYGGRARGVRGDMMRFVRWEPVLRAMFHGRPLFDPQRAELRDRQGAPLDPREGFRPDREREDMAHFLRTAGYLLVKGVFSPAEVSVLLEQAELARDRARPGDKKSWWGKNAGGETVLCRVLDAGALEPLREVSQDERLLRLAALSDTPLVPERPNAKDGVTVLFKNPDMVEGLSNIPWHRDCGMGGHAVMCPILICTLYLTAGTAEAGELRVIPGSWQGSMGSMEPGQPGAPEGVAIAGEPGDVSLHYGDLMHASPSPSGDGPYRICALLAFKRPDARHHRGERHYNDVLLQREDGQVEHLQKIVRRS